MVSEEVQPDPNLPAQYPQESYLTDQQSKLLRIFESLSPEIAQMYYGALRVLSDESNPDRLALAAHGIREIIEKMPKHFDVPIGSQIDWGRVDDLKRLWKAEDQLQIVENNAPLSPKFVKKLREFFDWWEEIRPDRRKEARELFRKMIPSHSTVPTEVEKKRLADWAECKRYFVGVSHHGKASHMKEFENYEAIFAGILISFAQPPIFEIADVLDTIIKEGEAND